MYRYAPPLQPVPRCEDGGGRCYWDLPVKAEGSAYVGLLVHQGEQKAAREREGRRGGEGRGGEGAHQRLSLGGSAHQRAGLEDVCLLNAHLPSCVLLSPAHPHCFQRPEDGPAHPTSAAGAEMMVPAESSEVWLVGDEQVGFLSLPDLTQVPAGSITKQGAIW